MSNQSYESRNLLTLFPGEPFGWDELTDAKIVFGDKIYHCHRSALGMAGSVFRAQLTAPLEGGEPNTFHVDVPSMNLTKEAVDAFVVALYRPSFLSEIKCPVGLVQVYHLLDYYGLHKLFDLCIDNLLTLVSDTTARDLLVFAKSTGIGRLVDACAEHIASMGEGVWRETEWVDFAREHPEMMVAVTQRLARNRDRALQQQGEPATADTNQTEQNVQPVLALGLHLLADHQQDGAVNVALQPQQHLPPWLGDPDWDRLMERLLAPMPVVPDVDMDFRPIDFAMQDPPENNDDDDNDDDGNAA